MKPNVLCKLKKGRLIDMARGFVDTFNYIVDFIENLRGDGDDDAARHVTVDRSVPDRPVIRFSGSSGGECDEVSTTLSESGYEGKVAVKGFVSAAENQVLAKSSSATTWQHPIPAEGTTGSVVRCCGVKVASASDSNVTCQVAVDANGIATLTVGVYYK